MARLIAWHGPLADPGSSSQQDPETEKRVLVHIAEFDEPVTEDFIYGQNPCPTFFQPYEFEGRINNRLFVIGRDTQQMPEAPQSYIVRVTYSNKWDAQQNDGRFQWIENPLLRPALITWGRYTDREAFEFAYKEDDQSSVKTELVATTAGEPLVLEESVNYRAITIEKNVREVTDMFAEGEDFINFDTVRIGGHSFKPKTLWLLPIEIGHLSFQNGFYFFPIVLTIMHNPNTWIRRIRNAGYYMRSFTKKTTTTRPGGGFGQSRDYYPLEPIIFTDGRKADRPILLNKEGRPIQSVATGFIQDPEFPTDPNKKIYFYGIQSPDDFGRAFTPAELAEATRYFRTRKYLNFTSKIGNVLK